MDLRRFVAAAVGLCAFVVGSTLLTALPVIAADWIDSVEDAYAVRHLRRTPFESRAALHLAAEESRFLEELFELTDEVVVLNVNVLRWFSTTGAQGIHAADYLERLDALRTRLDEVEGVERLESVRVLVADSLRLQRGFIAEWQEAIEDGRPFESQLTDEFAYHEGLHRSQRMLLKAFAELRALFPNTGESVQMAFHDHLRAMSLK